MTACLLKPAETFLPPGRPVFPLKVSYPIKPGGLPRIVTFSINSFIWLDAANVPVVFPLSFLVVHRAVMLFLICPVLRGGLWGTLGSILDVSPTV